MSSAVTGKGVPVKVPSRSNRLSVLRLMRMAVAFVVVAGSLGLATVTATAQDGGSSCPSADAEGYGDVNSEGTHADNITCLKELGIPAEGDAYRPSDDMTRSEMARFMARTYAIVTGEEAEVADHAFTDVSADDPNADDIARIAGLGITNGVNPEGTLYDPDGTVIRGHMALFLTRLYTAAAGEDAPAADTEFTDIAERSDEQQAAIGQIFGLGVTTGTTPTTYSPSANVTREQMGSFVARMYRALVAELADQAAEDAEAERLAALVPAGAPTGVTLASSDDGTELAVSWTAPEDSGGSDITGYVVQWKSGEDDYSEDNQSDVTETEASIGDLTSGVEYTVSVMAVNNGGNSESSEEATATTSTVAAAGVPTGVEVAISGEDGDALDVSWTAPEDSGTHDVTGYVVQWKSGDDDYSDDNQVFTSDTSANLDDLTQGDTYTFHVAAVSDAGTGDWSEEASGNPAVAPGLVGELKSVPGNSTLTLTWTAPADDGGSEVTGYVVSWRTGRQASADTAEVTGTEYTITGLRNTVNYSVWVAAMNAAGTGDTALVPAGTGSVSVSPTPTAASAPQNFTATPMPTLLILSWTGPANDGGTVLLNYTREHRCGDTTEWGTPMDVAHVATSQIQGTQITGLDNGEACEVRIRANSYNDANDNDTQDGTATDEENPERTLNSPWAEASGTPVTIPGAPASVSVQPAHQSLQVTWTAPASDGGSDITGYKVEWSAGVPSEATVGDVTSYTISGLSNSYLYTVNVTSITAAGESADSTAASDPVQPRAVPAAPSSVTVSTAPVLLQNGDPNTAAGTTLVVTWGASPSNGTNAVEGYVVQRRDSAIPDNPATEDDDPTAPTEWVNTGVGTIDVAKRTVTITGLDNGKSYDVQVQANNDHDDDTDTAAVGGPWAMDSGTPAALPAAIATVTTNAGYTSLDVGWTPPASNGDDITHYLVRYAQNVTMNEPFSSDRRVNAPLTRIRLTGLAVGVPYAIQIQAVNGIGTGPNAETDFTAATGLHPEAPSSVTAVPLKDGDGTMLTVTWTTVTRTNGSGPVTSYTVETLAVDPVGDGEWNSTPVPDSTDKTADVTVADGTTYLVRVKANSGTTGIPGYAAAPVKAAGVPEAPGGVAATIDQAVSTTVNVVWDSVPEAESADSDITGYVVSWHDTGDLVSGNRGSVSITGNTNGAYAITGLAPGAYSVSVTATNHVGNSSGGTPATVTVDPPS